MNEDIILTVAVAIFGVASFFLATRISHAKLIVREIKELFEELEIALEDGKLDKDEIKKIIAEGKEIAVVFMKKGI